ncbi:hypothetical protein BRETT_004085 [Brettanomyces bruxellensis]|uniref:4'-phosphopantetheinyl transferase domain-containing protein n=1 Tax=Dekkera bruxellensis TaxID=5007 RepID=A0A871R1C1_DEKBR|nr:uncharacterized protein BRETT_004085 [Brettanomyces bruxellensis]QOU18866.1 hypothetical protein BRETT_004085 [Brettanomyces bruxellensis]
MKSKQFFTDFERVCFNIPAETDSSQDSSTILFFYLDLRNEGIVQHFLDQFTFEICSRILPLKQQHALKKTLVHCLIFKIAHGKFGKPVFSNRPDYSFNSSDEESISSVAVCFHGVNPIGCDLSNPSDIGGFHLSDLRDFYKYEFRDIFTEMETIELDKMFKSKYYADRNNQLQMLSQYWAIKESLSKMDGYGLNYGLRKYEVLGIGHPTEFIRSNKKSMSKSLFEYLGNTELKPVGEPKSGVRNACFTIPETRLICSVVGRYSSVKIIKVDAEGISDLIKSAFSINIDAV